MSQSVFLLAALRLGVDAASDASVFLDSAAAGGETACWGARTVLAADLPDCERQAEDGIVGQRGPAIEEFFLSEEQSLANT
jgi:hypothetical protein